MMIPYRSFINLILLASFVSACTSAGTLAPQNTDAVEPPLVVSTATVTPQPVIPTHTLAVTETPAASPTLPTVLSPTPADIPTLGPTATLGPEDWKKMPVLPRGISQRVRLIYQMGLLKGNNPRAFSKVGDCNSTMPYFLGDFDTPGQYDLGEYSQLQETIGYFSGSFSRKSLAAKDGLTSFAALSTLWVDWKDCETYETPLTCEFRNQKPAFAILSFGTNDANGNVDFEIAFRRVVDMTIGNGVVPILSTKADNAEYDESINAAIARVAYEYELPLWNYWLAAQSLPDKGLRTPEHLSASPLGYSNFEGENLNYGWSVRNLTALQVLDMVRRSIIEEP
ncbi:MAG: SGNH/GDSL hydrolase family protein [Anaerolineaceae bacterium]|nr:SGNH/GDSL hydrolase family protein [Anaerolineaceae bacterium]